MLVFEVLLPSSDSWGEEQSLSEELFALRVIGQVHFLSPQPSLCICVASALSLVL